MMQRIKDGATEKRKIIIGLALQHQKQCTITRASKQHKDIHVLPPPHKLLMLLNKNLESWLIKE